MERSTLPETPEPDTEPPEKDEKRDEGEPEGEPDPTGLHDHGSG